MTSTELRSSCTAEAIRNSMTPGKASPRRRMKSSVQLTRRPSVYTGSQLVTPWTCPSASTATQQSTSASSSSSMPPRVKPISGTDFWAAHSSETSLSWARSAGEKSA